MQMRKARGQECTMLPDGCHARLRGLVARPELNDLEVVVLSWVADRGRQATRLVSSGEHMLVRPQNLERSAAQFDSLPTVLLFACLAQTNDAKAIGHAAAACRTVWVSRQALWRTCCIERWGLLLSESLPVAAAAQEAKYMQRDPNIPENSVWVRYYRQRARWDIWQTRAKDLQGDEWWVDIEGVETSWPDRDGIYSRASLRRHVELAVEKCAAKLAPAGRAEWATLANNVYLLRSHQDGDVDDNCGDVQLRCLIYSTHSPASVEVQVDYHDRSRWDDYEHYQRGLLFVRLVPEVVDTLYMEVRGKDVEDNRPRQRLFCAMSNDTATSVMSHDPDPSYWGMVAGDSDVPCLQECGCGALSPMHLYAANDAAVLTLQSDLVRPESHASLRHWWRFLLAASGMQVVTESIAEPSGWLHQLVYQHTDGDEPHPPYLSESPCTSSKYKHDRKTGIDGLWRYESDTPGASGVIEELEPPVGIE
jgi:hypothetical protein